MLVPRQRANLVMVFQVAPRVRKIIQGYGRQATHTIVDQIFGGQLISTGNIPNAETVQFISNLDE